MARGKKNKKNGIKSNTVIGIIAAFIIAAAAYFSKDVINLIEGDIDLTGKFAVHFLDIGQGDAILIQNPENEFMLIDTGDRDKDIKLMQYLENYNVKNFKYAIFTHPHADHIGSADKIVKNYGIETLIMPKAVNTSQTFLRLVEEIENKNLEITQPNPGQSFKFGSAEFIILAPNSEQYENLNNYSIALKMKYGGFSFLFTGDMEKEAENEVIGFCEKNNISLTADVLKIGHHGSSTSTQKSFLDLVSPSVSVIMCGEGNDYGHPTIQTLNRLEQSGSKIFRTDIDGDIIAIVYEGNLSVKKSKEDPFN